MSTWDKIFGESFEIGCSLGITWSLEIGMVHWAVTLASWLNCNCLWDVGQMMCRFHSKIFIARSVLAVMPSLVTLKTGMLGHVSQISTQRISLYIYILCIV